MKALPLCLLLSAAALADAPGQGGAPSSPLTLDPELYAEALREVQGLPGATPPAENKEPSASPEGVGALASAAAEAALPGVEDWEAAMRDAGTELADVRLLVLLQRLNPLDPPAARAADYASVLRVHHLMLAGNSRACLTLADAFRKGRFENGLLFIQSELLAAALERRSRAFLTPLHDIPASPVR